MSDVLKLMIDCINESQCGIAAEYAFRSDFLKRAVSDRSVYFKADSVKPGVVDFTGFVYTPVFENGEGCIETAKTICRVLREGKFDISDLRIEGVEYNGNSLGFVSKIRGSISDSSDEFVMPGGCFLMALGYGDEKVYKLDFGADSYKVSGDLGVYPIMTVFEELPFDFHRCTKEFKIKLYGVRKIYAKEIIAGGKFVLVISDYEFSFVNCFCEEIEFTAYNKVDLTIRGYVENGI